MIDGRQHPPSPLSFRACRGVSHQPAGAASSALRPRLLTRYRALPAPSRSSTRAHAMRPYRSGADDPLTGARRLPDPLAGCTPCAPTIGGWWSWPYHLPCSRVGSWNRPAHNRLHSRTPPTPRLAVGAHAKRPSSPAALSPFARHPPWLPNRVVTVGTPSSLVPDRAVAPGTRIESRRRPIRADRADSGVCPLARDSTAPRCDDRPADPSQRPNGFPDDHPTS